MRNKLISLVSIFVFILISLSTKVDAASLESKRLGGADRYETCSQIVNEGWKSSDYVVIVNGSNFPDALSASTLAKKYNAPILLNESTKLGSITCDQIKRLNVKKAFIVGGTGVISSKIEDQLHAMKIESERFHGLDRTATSVAVANKIGTSNGIILTTDSDYTEALSISPIAAKLQIPIILVPKDSIPTSVSKFIRDKNIPKTYVLGGEDLISDVVSSQFSNVKRIPGNNKYERNINIINAFSDKFDFNSICLAYSEDFADALSGSAFAALNDNPVILVGSRPTPVTQKFISNKNFSKLYVLGGIAGITENTLAVLINKGKVVANTNNKVNKNTDEVLVVKDKNKEPQPKPSPISVNNNTNSHSEVHKNLYNYFMNADNRNSVMKRAIQLHDGDTKNNCVYFASEGLRRAGISDLPEWVCNTGQLTSQLLKRGWAKCKDLSQLRPGDICFTTNGPSHTYTFMKWCDTNYKYAYVCDNQGNEYGGNAYHKRNVNFATVLKDAIDYFMYKQ